MKKLIVIITALALICSAAVAEVDIVEFFKEKGDYAIMQDGNLLLFVQSDPSTPTNEIGKSDYGVSEITKRREFLQSLNSLYLFIQQNGKTMMMIEWIKPGQEGEIRNILYNPGMMFGGK